MKATIGFTGSCRPSKLRNGFTWRIKMASWTLLDAKGFHIRAPPRAGCFQLDLEGSGMKRQWGHPSVALPLLVALFMLLTFRCSLRHAQAPASRDGDAGDYVVDATLAELAAADPAAAAVLRDAEALLEGNLTRAPPEHRDAAVRRLRGWIAGQRFFFPGVMAELVDLIKRPIDRYAGAGRERDEPGRRPYASCAVVGNSGVLLAREHGALIDGHDLVVRLNNAPAGEEGSWLARHVGARTGLAFLNSNVLSRCAAAAGAAAPTATAYPSSRTCAAPRTSWSTRCAAPRPERRRRRR